MIDSKAISVYLSEVGTEAYQPLPALLAKIESVSAKYSNPIQVLA